MQPCCDQNQQILWLPEPDHSQQISVRTSRYIVIFLQRPESADMFITKYWGSAVLPSGCVQLAHCCRQKGELAELKGRKVAFVF